MSPSEGSYFGLDILIAIMKGLDSITAIPNYASLKQPKKLT
jgi:hypothetical protein